jgi:hypothetical protein
VIKDNDGDEEGTRDQEMMVSKGSAMTVKIKIKMGRGWGWDGARSSGSEAGAGGGVVVELWTGVTDFNSILTLH